MPEISDAVFEKLWTGAWQGTILIAIVWIITRLVKNLSPKARYGLWWVASLKLLLVFLPAIAIPLPFATPIPQPVTSGVEYLATPTFIPQSTITDGIDPGTRAPITWQQIVVVCLLYTSP